MRFLHLSDIHFANCDGSPHTDVDTAVRERMLDNIREMHDQLGEMNAVLVVGDIAAGGKQADYEVAAEFIERTCGMVGLEPDQVVCVPGNHDIDRDLQGALHEAVRFQLRRVEVEKISDVLLRLLRQGDGRQILLRPLEAYNEFALRYGCAIDPELLLWKPKILNIGARKVHLHGVNSAWICDASDSFERDCDRAVVGLFQVTPIAQDSSAISIALCHHPGRWLRDKAIVGPWLARAQIVLTGHEHEAGVKVSADRRSIRIASGAVNPGQTEGGWIPAYNVIELELVNVDRLRVRVFSQSWQSAYAEFGPDQFAPQPFSCELRLGASPAVVEARDVAESAPGGGEVLRSGDTTIVVSEPEVLMSDERRMVYNVMSASPDVRRGAARELGLFHEHEELGGTELDKELLRRAVDNGQLVELSVRITHGE